MSVIIDGDTVVKSLWLNRSQGPSMLSNGRFLQLRLDGGNGSGFAKGAPFSISSVAFHPVDETQVVLGTTTGALYGVSLRENKLFFLCDVCDGKSVRAVVFHGSSVGVGGGSAPNDVGSPHVVAVSEGNTVSFVDWRSAVVLQQTQCGAHSRPVTSATVSDVALPGEPTPSQAVVLLSADAVSCWVPRRPIAQADGGDKQFYLCVGSAAPAQCTLAASRPNHGVEFAAGVDGPTEDEQAQGPSAHPQLSQPPPRPSEVHRFLTAHVSNAHVYTTETNGVVARWALAPESLTRPGSSSSSSSSSLRLDRCVQTLPFRASCSACCSAFLALGCRDMAAVALIDTDTMDGLGFFQISQEEGNVAAAAVVVGRTPVHVQQLSIVGSELLCCALTDGRVICVAASTHQCVFVLRPPQTAVSHRFCLPLTWRFLPSGPTYGAFYSASECVLVHLPTARAYYDRCMKLYRGEGGHHALIDHHPFGLCTTTAMNGGGDGKSATGGGGGGGAGDVFTFTVKVFPFLTQRRRRGERPDSQKKSATDATAAAAATTATATATATATTTTATTTATAMGQVAPRRPSAEHQRRFPRKPLVFSSSSSSLLLRGGNGPSVREGWIDVNAMDSTKDHRGGGSGVPRDEQRALSTLARALYSDTLSDAACAYNMDKLREYLNKHGVFPRAFRPAIWRFVLGLPDRRRTAPQFASLARQKTHSCVATHMEPFPLPRHSVRAAMEQCVSALAHHAPAFAVADFLPAFVFPLVHVFSEKDTQSVVEVLLVFFSNWGLDFFQCYPQPPAGLMRFMQHRLAAVDADLAEHFHQMGCGPDVWCWQPILSLLTDVLTGAEWLQVMDHAFMMEPIWLFLFLLAMVVSHRGALMREGLGLSDVIRTLAHPFSQQQPSKDEASSARDSEPRLSGIVSEAIELAYQLYAKCPRDTPFMNHYHHFRSLEPPAFRYPTDFPVDPEVMSTRMAQLFNLEAKRQEEERAEVRLQALTREAKSEAIREEVLLQQQRARIAAKYDTSSEAWRARVALEKTRQAREAKEREMRLNALRSRLASAEELDRIREEMASVDAQTRHDVVDRLVEQHKWALASDITTAELEQLERDAEARVAEGLRRLMRNPPGAAAGEGGGRWKDGALDGGFPPDTQRPRECATESPTPQGPYSENHERQQQQQQQCEETCVSASSPTKPEPPGHDDDNNNNNSTDGEAAKTRNAHVRLGEPQHNGAEAEKEEQQQQQRQQGEERRPPVQHRGLQAEPPEVRPQEQPPDAQIDEEDMGDDEEDMDAYNNREEYPNTHHPLSFHAPSEEDSRAEAALDDLHAPRAAPLPTHLAPFVPSAELLKALQGYHRRADRYPQLRGSTAVIGGECAYPYDRPAFQPNAYQQQFHALQRQAQGATSSGSASSTRAPPHSLKPRTGGGAPNKRPLFDNLSDEPTSTTRSDMARSEGVIAATGAGRASGTTATTSPDDTASFTSDASPLPGRAVAGPRPRHATATTATMTATTTTATTASTGTSGPQSSSAASALRRPWRDEYYYR